MTLVSEYLKIQKECMITHGDRTVLLMQVGSFYEMYGVSNGTDSEDNCELLFKIAMLLGCKIRYKNSQDQTNRGTIKNPYLVGFPCVAYSMKEFLLLSNNYKIIVYDQCAGDKTKREQSGPVRTPHSSDAIVSENGDITNQIMFVYIEVIPSSFPGTVPIDNPKKIEKLGFLIGISLIDITTGKNEVKEIYTRKEDSKYVINELYRILVSSKPKELQFYINLNKKNIDKTLFERYLITTLELNSYPLLNISFDIDKEYLSDAYQEQFLNLTFKKRDNEVPVNFGQNSQLKLYLNRGNIINIFTELGLDKFTCGIVSYILLIQYCHHHNATLFSKIKKPIVSNEESSEDQKLTLEYNSIIQLNLIQSNISKVNYRIKKGKNYDTLLSIVGNCTTCMGKRIIREKLLSPSTNVKCLREKYEIIDYLRNQKDYREKCLYKLKELYDIEKLNFKLLKGTITPKEFYNLYTSYPIVIELINLSIEHVYESTNNKYLPLFYIFPNRDDLISLNSCITDIQQTFDLENLGKCNIIGTLLNCKNCPTIPGKNVNFDNYQNVIFDCTQRLEAICNHIEYLIGTPIEADSFAKKKKKAQNADDEEDEEIVNMKDLGIYLTLTKYNKLKQNLHKVQKDLCGELKFESKNKKYRVTSNIIETLCSNILKCRNELSPLLYSFYLEYLTYVNNKYDMTGIIKFIIDLDIGITNAINSIKFNYHKPIVHDSPKGNSFIKAKNLRHPLVERIINNEYISNDITLNVDHNGVLLYACNSAGKTTFATSIANAVIMAQAEMWTAGEIEFYPYDSIATRLSGHDDVEKGHSSFVVEALELRSILRNANSKTLVIGDELCRGTESLSGSALTIGTVEELVKRNVSFIFSTHLHDIPNKKRISNLVSDGKLFICHLENLHDPISEELIYNRKIKPGSGESIYGIEVAKSLDIDRKFIENVEIIRKELLNEPVELLSFKKARYNPNYYKQPCVICGNYNLEINQVHHIKEQSISDNNGFIGDMHKNNLSNLLSLCKNCHMKIHSDRVKVNVMSTSKGIYLTFNKDGEIQGTE